MSGWVWLTPFVGAFIGWLTNYVAIKMLFRPREPKRLLGLSLQGVMPKRQHDLALKIGEVVEKELLKSEDILNAINTEELRGHLATIIESRIDRFLREKLFRGDFLYSKVFSREAVQRAKRAFIAAYERRLDQEVTHPLFGYRVSMRRLLEVQARLLVRYLMGEIDEYPHYRVR